ncbi:hypothetical protein ABZX92_18210 [Lentzea sp. NPDC006480]|uniref:hypothetical protein n=1 Tax=Lentzea sp. NPDC006480 TaxID=3157176 RepID=UPI0033A3CB6D
MWRNLLALAVVAAGATWYLTQDTVRDVDLRHAARFQTMREALHDIAQALPQEGQVRDTGCPGVPEGEQLFDHPDVHAQQYPRSVGNTVVLTPQQLTDPTSLLRQNFHDYLPADEDYEPYVEAVSRIRYVVVPRTFNVDIGPVDALTFTGATASAEAVIADLTTRTILCSVTTTATLAANEISYTYRDPEHRDENAKAAIASAVTNSAMTALQFKLDVLRHGKIDLRH